MKNKVILPLVGVGLLLAGAQSLANEYAAQEIIKSLEGRINALESTASKQSAASNWIDKLVFAGLVEIEAGYNKGEAGGSSSDLVVATVELGLAAEITDSISSEIVFLYEEDNTDFGIDVAVLNFAAGDAVNFTVGQTYLPFGVFESHVHSVNDPLILALTEAVETAAMGSYEVAGFTGQFYVFNGDVDTTNNTLENYGLRLSYAADGLSVGIDYISNVLDADGISGALLGGKINLADDLNLNNSVGAGVFNLSYSVGPAKVIFEAFKAEQFKAAEFGGFITTDIDVSAYQLQGVLHVTDWTLALSYQKTEEAAALGMPEQRVSVSASTELYKATGLALELWHDEDYAAEKGGTGNDAIGLVAQLAVAF